MNNDAPMFEYLCGQGAVIPTHSNIDNSQTSLLLEHRATWLQLATRLIHGDHLPLVAIRTIHEFLFVHNWSMMYGELAVSVGEA